MPQARTLQYGGPVIPTSPPVQMQRASPNTLKGRWGTRLGTNASPLQPLHRRRVNADNSPERGEGNLRCRSGAQTARSDLASARAASESATAQRSLPSGLLGPVLQVGPVGPSAVTWLPEEGSETILIRLPLLGVVPATLPYQDDTTKYGPWLKMPIQETASASMVQSVGSIDWSLRDWMADFSNDRSVFCSPYLFAEIKLREALTAVSHLPRPNHYHLAAVMEVMRVIAEAPGPMRSLLSMMNSEVHALIYHHMTAHSARQDDEGLGDRSEVQVPYFQTCARFEMLYLKLKRAKEKHFDRLQMVRERMEGANKQKHLADFLLFMSFELWRTRTGETKKVEKMISNKFSRLQRSLQKNIFKQWKGLLRISRTNKEQSKTISGLQDLNKELTTSNTLLTERDARRKAELAAMEDELNKDRAEYLAGKLKEVKDELASMQDKARRLIATVQKLIQCAEMVQAVCRDRAEATFDLRCLVPEAEAGDVGLGVWITSNLDPDRLVLRWVSLLLQQEQARIDEAQRQAKTGMGLQKQASKRMSISIVEAQVLLPQAVTNFTSDLRDGRVLSALVHILLSDGRSVLDPSRVICVDNLKAIATACQEIAAVPGLEEIPRVDDFVRGTFPDRNCLLLTSLFLVKPGLPPRLAEVDALGKAFQEAREWVATVLDDSEETLADVVEGEEGQRAPGEIAPVSVKMVSFVKCEELLAQGDGLVSRLESAIGDAQRSVTTAENDWRVIQLQVRRWMAWVRRCREIGQPAPIIDAEKAAEVEAFSKVDCEMLKVIVEEYGLEAQSRTNIELELSANMNVLRSVFLHYGSSNLDGEDEGSDGTLDQHEFNKFVSDCRLLSSGRLQLDDAAKIFWQVNDYTSSEQRKLMELDSNGFLAADNPDVTLMPSEFVHALLRIAALCFADGTPQLHDRLHTLIHMHIIPFATQREGSEFSRIMASESVTHVTKRYRECLYKVFKYYAALDVSTNTAKQRVTTLSEKEWLQMVADVRLVDSVFTNREAKFVFQESTNDSQSTGSDRPLRGAEMMFTQFIDCVSTVAMYKLCNPFTPFHTRLRKFLSELFFPFLTGKVPQLQSALQEAKTSEVDDRAAQVSDVGYQRKMSSALSRTTSVGPPKPTLAPTTSTTQNAANDFHSLERVRSHAED